MPFGAALPPQGVALHGEGKQHHNGGMRIKGFIFVPML